ncbi:unnamed protein product [Urochloa humidicola]
MKAAGVPGQRRCPQCSRSLPFPRGWIRRCWLYSPSPLPQPGIFHIHQSEENHRLLRLPLFSTQPIQFSK